MKFSQMKDWSSSNYYIRNEFDDTPLKVLYDNCVRAEHDNVNVLIASIDPESWFMELADDLRENATMIIKSPQTLLSKISDDGYVNCTTHNLESTSFENKEDLIFFLQEKKMYRISIFSITKTLDLQTLKYSWNLRYCLILDREGVRNLKIDYISSHS